MSETMKAHDGEVLRPRGQMLPDGKLGFVNPLDVLDTFPYEFYRIAPASVIACLTSVRLAGFGPEAAQQAVNDNLETALYSLISRRVDHVTLGGVPLLLNLGRDYVEDFRGRCYEQFHIPAHSSMDCVIDAFKQLKVSRIAAVNKWDGRLNSELRSWLGGESIDVIGVAAQVHEASEVKKGFDQGFDVARRLADQALRQYPDAECLWIGGGAWLVLSLIEPLEREFGVPIVANAQTKAWFSLRQIDRFEPVEGFGRLLSSPEKQAVVG